MSSKETWSACFRVTSRNSASRTPRMSPSSSSSNPVLRRTLRIAFPLPTRLEGLERGDLFAVDVDELVHAGHGDHGLDPRLDPGELHGAVPILHQAVDVHEAPDGRAVHVGDGLEVDD